MPTTEVPSHFAGRDFDADDLALIRDVVKTCAGLSRTELAKTVCELLGCRRPNGSLIALECREYLESLEECGFVRLPPLRRRRPKGSTTRIPRTARGEPGEALVGSVEEFGSLRIEEVRSSADSELFRELVGRYHYQGYTVAFGAQLRYLVWIEQPQRQVVGCLRFSSPAWRLSARDQWIGWSETVRCSNLQRVVNNSRFLLLPWVQIRNLASRVLAQGARQMTLDWPIRYGLEPLLLETLVDPSRFQGTCYRAANWIEVGLSAGRGRMDRAHQRHGLSPKKVFLYPLVRGAARRLRQP